MASIYRIRERQPFEFDDDDNDVRNIAMQSQRIRRDNVLEAQIQEGDTLQAVALRYNCTVGSHFPP